jgi:hypothetical protein
MELASRRRRRWRGGMANYRSSRVNINRLGIFFWRFQ